MSRNLFFLSLLLCLVLVLACGGGDSGAGSSGAESAPEPAADEPAPVEPAEPLGSSTIAGTVTYNGEVPNLRPLRMDADPKCLAQHEGPVPDEKLVLGDGNTMANVFVRVKWEGGAVAAPRAPVVMDQNGCQYMPHVMGIQVGQTFRILNSDGLLHNVHSLSELNPPFNRAMPATVNRAEFTFDKEEDFRVKCDVHPWMGAYLSVLNHPFFGVSNADGSFEISGLPAGTYELEAWHEALGTQSGSVTVADGEAGTVDFTFTR